MALCLAESLIAYPHLNPKDLLDRFCLWASNGENTSTGVCVGIGQNTLRVLGGLTGQVPEGTRFVLVETDGIGPQHPLSGEKLSRVAALYRARDYAQAVEITRQILQHQGAGHSLGVHTTDALRPVELGFQMPTCRVIVNQAHCFATGGAFDNGLPFSLSMGCGSWGGNSIDDNLHWRHFMQRAKVVRAIAPHEPTLDQIFADYWGAAGK